MSRTLALTLAATTALHALPAAPQTKQWSAPGKTQQWSAPTQKQPPPAPQAGPGRVLAMGEAAQVAWSGGWYDATVLALGEGTYKVHYQGWGSEWDEWVPSSRMRLTDGGAIAAPPSAPAKAGERPATPATTAPAPKEPKILSASPPGHYTCRTFEANQVNVVGEFFLRADGSYKDVFNKGSGRYSYDTAKSLLTFTSGPQASAKPTITFLASGHHGRGHIVFDYGGGARLDCYRESLR